MLKVPTLAYYLNLRSALNLNKYGTFWTQFDSTGFSIHRGYYKYNDEFSPLAFIRRNVVTGIVQSMDSSVAHKNLFG